MAHPVHWPSGCSAKLIQLITYAYSEDFDLAKIFPSQRYFSIMKKIYLRSLL